MSSRVGFDTSALDDSFKEHSLRGIGRYVFELRKFFDRTNSQEIKVDYFDHHSLLPANWLDSAINLLPAGRQTVRSQLMYPLVLGSKRTQQFEVLHFPAHMDAPSWSPKPYILTVLDLIPLVCADLYRAERPSWRFGLARWLELRAIRGARLILAISQNTAKDIERLLGIPAEKIVVTPLGVDESFFDIPGPELKSRWQHELSESIKLPPNRPVVLYVGGIDPRKNWRLLLQAFKELLQLRQETGQSLPVLVMAGKHDSDRQYPKLKECIGQLGLESEVFLPGYVDDLMLKKLFACASVFFFPSLYEGFGLPPLEALASGLPVVSSNSSAMPEVLADAALMVPPTDVPQNVLALNQILSQPDLALDLSRRGPIQARKFTWQKTGELTLEAYRRFFKQQLAPSASVLTMRTRTNSSNV